MGRNILVVLLAAAPAAAEAADQNLSALYELRWEGVTVGEFALDVELDETTYSVTYEAQSRGFVDLLANFHGEGSSNGLREDNRFQSLGFRGSSRWRGGGSRWTVAFDRSGKVTKIEVPEDSIDDREQVAEELKVAPDPFSLALDALMIVEPGSQLKGRSFDGKRAVEHQINCPESSDQRPKTLECSMRGHVIGGGSREWNERAREEQQTRRPMLLTLEDGILDGHYWPVRMDIESSYGEIEIELVDTVQESDQS